ncbi:hypothetical protein Psfp_02339 [Pelotomaculum sp. FP]|nr:hypothetical protein Psfp_02339 [Pelotomaculum sp. FP]
MDYNFAYCVMWFFSCPWVIKAVGFVSLGLGLAATMIRFV